MWSNHDLISSAYVHILVLNNQAVPHTFHNIIQNYRCRIKRKMCLFNLIIMTARIYGNVPDFSVLIPRHNGPRP
jgi:hypothetical protein